MTLQRKKDFADWVSPTIVKELRQGLRTWVFVGAFILLHLVLVFMVMLQVLEGGGDIKDHTEAFWAVVSSVMVGIMPLRGLNSVADERKTGTFDLLQLANVGSMRLMVGKWFSLAVQTALVGISLAPYIVLRYFVGGVAVVDELLLLGWLLALSLFAVAVIVAFSVTPWMTLRLLLSGGFLCLIGAGVAEFIDDMGRGRSELGFLTLSEAMPDTFGWVRLLIFCGWVACLIFIPLSVGASRIAPKAQNGTTLKRLLVLALWLVTAVAMWRAEFRFDLLLGLVVIVSSCALLLDAFFEEVSDMAVTYQPFVARGWLGRCVGRFMYPGWPSAMQAYSVILVGVLISILGAWLYPAQYALLLSKLDWSDFSRMFNDRAVPRWIILLTSPFPALLIAWAWKGKFSRLGVFIIVIALSLCWGAMFYSSGRTRFAPIWPIIGAITPLGGISTVLDSRNWLSIWITWCGAWTGLLWWLVGWLMAERKFRQIRELESEAATLVAEAKKESAKAASEM